MRTLLILAAISLISPAASGQNVTDCYNGFGIYMKPDPPMLANYTEYDGPTGTVTAYMLLLNPYNQEQGRPITNLGGYEMRLEVPDHLQVTYGLHGQATNFETPPVFFVGLGAGVGLPISGDRVLLMTLEIEAPTDEPAFIHVQEYPNCGIAGCYPALSVVDADGWGILDGTPTSYDFEAPVFCMFAPCDDAPGGYPPGGSGGVWGDCWVVPARSTTWGGIKAMYR